MKKDNNFVALTKCFVCGEGSDILLGTRFQDMSKFHDKVVTTKPCQKCQEMINEGGVWLISARPVKSEEEKKNPYRTGGLACVKKEALLSCGIPESFLNRGVCFIENEVWKELGLPDADKLVD